jgi:hypothetical protein
MIMIIREPVQIMGITMARVRRDPVILVGMIRSIEVSHSHGGIDDAAGDLGHLLGRGIGGSGRRGRGRRRGRLGRRGMGVRSVAGGLQGAGIHDAVHVLLVAHVLVSPAPFLAQLGLQKIDAPARFLFDLAQDRQDLFLLLEVCQALGADADAADAGACHAAEGVSEISRDERWRGCYRSLLCATIPQIIREWYRVISHISGSPSGRCGFICPSKHMDVW